MTMRVIITGADGALGKAAAARFRDDGAHVATLVGHSDGDEGAGSFVAAHLEREADAKAVIDKAAGWLGGVDALVQIVGGFTWTKTEAGALDAWRAMFEINVATAVASVAATLPHLKAGGAIVLVGANSAQPAGAGMGPYGAAKSGVARLTEALAAELRPKHVRVNAILPQTIDTPANRAEMPDADFSTWTSPAAIADTIRFLASPDARAITGALIPVTNAG